MGKINRILQLVCLLGSTMLIPAQTPDFQSSKTLPLDPEIRYGKLDNGLTYYIKNIPTASTDIFMHLIIKAGAYQEARDQYQLAHFIEHIPFVRTPNLKAIYSNTELLGPLGMGAGDFFAQTSRSYTNYKVHVPDQNEKAMDLGMLWFHDIINGKLEFADVDVLGEREPFFQEYVFRKGKYSFLNELVIRSLSDCIKNESLNQFNYKEYVNNIKRVDLLSFYKKWYRPDMAAISMVGNIKDLDYVEKMIKDQFSDIELPPAVVSPQDCFLEYLNRSRQFVLLEDDRSKGKEVQIKAFYRNYGLQFSAWGRLKSNLAMVVIHEVVKMKFSRALMDYNMPYNFISIYDPASLPAMEVRILTSADKVKESVQGAFGILRGLKINGIMAAEMDEIKEIIGRSLNNNELDPDYWINSIRNHFVNKEELPHDKNYHLQRWLKEMSLSELNSLLSEIIPDTPEDLVVIEQTGQNKLKNTEKEIRQWISNVRTPDVLEGNIHKDIAYSVDFDRLTDLNPVTYTEYKNPEVGVKEFVLENGAKIVLQTGNFQDKLILHAFNPKGLSCFPKEDYFSAYYAPSIINNSGVASLDKFELDNYLTGISSTLRIGHYIESQESGIKGEATLADLERLLQLVYLYFTEPRKDKLAFNDWENRTRNFYGKGGLGNSLDTDLFRNFMAKIANDSLISSPTAEQLLQGINKVNLDKSYEIFNEIFGSANEFTFLISGNFQNANVLALVRKYLGNLPYNQNCRSCSNTSLPKEIYKTSIVKEIPANHGLENTKIRMKYVYSVDSLYDWHEIIKSEFLTKVLYNKLDDLRFKKKRGVYLVNAHQWHYPDLKWNTISLNVDCSMEELEIIQKDIVDILKELKEDTISDQDFNYAANWIYLKYSSSNFRGSNKKMTNTLYEHFRFGEPILTPEIVEQYVRSIKSDDILNSAQKYLKEKFLSVYIVKNSDIHPMGK